jgi:hypothetical protein
VSDERAVTTSVEVDREGRYLDAPAEALDLFGVSLDELRAHRVGDFARPGLGPIHRALFLWVVRSGRDFGGGESTVVSADGVETPVECTSIQPVGDRYRVNLTVLSGEPRSVQTRAIASVLDAWREAEREIAQGASDPDYDLARDAANALSDVYQAVAAKKAVATDWVASRIGD